MLTQYCWESGCEADDGPGQVEQGALFYNFPLDDHVPPDHLLRSVDRFVVLAGLRRELTPFYSSTGGPRLTRS